MLYLKAAEIVGTYEEWEGRKGKFIKTFALNDKRNKNGWRVTWASIKKHIASFLGQPGIEYVKCEGSVCDLDHTEGTTFEQSLAVQEAYRVTTLIDFYLDDANHTAYFIHEVHDDEFYQKAKAGEIKYVSPAVWPLPGGYDILGKQDNGLPIVDVHEWKGLHDAFVNKPAFGDEAKVTATCEGEGCQLRLLSAADLSGPADELAPIKTVPILVRHKDKLVFVSVTEEEYNKIKALEKITESEILPILRASSSFHSCSCSSAHTMNDEERQKMESMKKAMDDKDKEIDKLKSKLTAMEEEEHKKNKEAKKGVEEEEEDKEKPKAKTAKTDPVVESEAYKALLARQQRIEADAARPLIAKMVEMRVAAGMPDTEVHAFETSLKAKSYEEIKAKHDDEVVYHTALKARAEDRTHLPWPETSELGALAGKSLEEIAEEAV